MLKKIISISNLGRLQDCSPVGDVEFKRLTLIYAENGHGKTTLCDLFRSLSDGDTGLIEGRRTLGSPAGARAEIRTDSATARFESGVWSSLVSGITVFDTRFVHENVYAGDVVVHEHKKRLYRIIIGEEGVQRAHQIEELDERIRQLGREVARQESNVDAIKPDAMAREAFIALEMRDSISDELTAAEASVRALRNAQEISTKPAPQPIATLSTLPPTLDAVIDRTIERVATDIETKVHEHLAQALRVPDTTWLSRGVDLASTSVCPLCGQALAGSIIMPDLRSYFGAAYTELKADLQSLKTSVAAFASEAQMERLGREVERNDGLALYWASYLPATVHRPELDVQSIIHASETLRQETLNLLERKEQALLEAIPRPPEYATAVRDYETACSRVTSYNDLVRTFVAAVASKKSELAGGDLARDERLVERLKATRKRHEEPAARACSEYARLKSEKDAATIEKQRARLELDRYTESVFARYQDDINDLLDRFGAGFSIGDTQGRYPGGTPSASFKIVINETPVDLGDGDTPEDRPSFRNTLSAGDRSALALAFFFASISRDRGLAGKIVVLDDPFTSQDRGRRTWTCKRIQMLVGRAQQVIVLSHDPYFLRDLAEDMPAGDVNTLQIAHFGTVSRIQEWNPTDECLEQHAKDHKALLRYQEKGEGEPGDLRARLRRLLENYLYMRLPDQFPGNTTLGGMIEAIRSATPSDPRAAAQGILSELEAINGYSVGEHHRARGGALEVIDSNELGTFVRRTLKLVRGIAATDVAL
jgi:wobble nucleotide-excising tRNase